MTERVEGQLAEAGRLLREWRDTHVAPEGHDVRLVLTPVASASARRPGRFGAGPWTRAGAVAAAVILVVGVVAMLTLASGNDTLPVATPGSAVALVPGDDLLEQYASLSIQQYGPTDPPRDRVYFVPVASVDGEDRVLVVREQLSIHQSPGPGTAVEVDGVTAHLVIDDVADAQSRAQHLLLPLDADGYERLRIVADPDRPLEVLVDLAVSIDPTGRLSDQDLPGWRVLASYDEALGRADFRYFALRGEDGSELAGSSWAGAGPGAEWFASGFSAHEDRREIDGRSIHVDHLTGETTFTWIEAPGLAIQYRLTDVRLDPDERLERLTGYLDHLVAVDQAGWDAFADRAEDRGAGDSMTTTMPQNTTTTVSAEASTRFTLGDGRVLDANFFRPDTVCWSEVGVRSVSHCSSPGSDDQVPGAPHLAVGGGEGTAQFVYGRLAEDAARLRVEVGETGEAIPFRLVDQRWWISELPPAGTRLVVVHLGPDGRILDRFELAAP